MKRSLLKIYEGKAIFSAPDKPSICISLDKDSRKDASAVSATAINTNGSNGASSAAIFSQKAVQLVDRQLTPEAPSSPSRSVGFEFIFGFYDLPSGPYAVLVTETEPFVDDKVIGSIRKVKKTTIVPLLKDLKPLSEPRQNDDDSYLRLLQKTLAENAFFLSTNYDLTLTQQRQSLLSSRNDPMWIRADHRFFWNRHVITDLINCKADDWITPFMSGFIDFRPDISVDNVKFSLLFISRRSRYRQGCRYTKRGLDEDGNPANFVETEQILIFSGDGLGSDQTGLTSFVQVRGSIPLKWSSPVTMKYDPKVFIDDDQSRQVDLALKHIKDCHDTYVDCRKNSRVIFVNLIDMKNDQKLLGDAFESTIKDVKTKIHIPSKSDDILKYVWFDFHKECSKKGKWDNLGKLVKMLDSDIKAQGYFCKTVGGAVTRYQTGVIRTNCMDNLDRTNVVQSLFARRSLIQQIGRSDLIEEDANDKLVLNSPWKAFEAVYKTVWTNNADSLSMSYAGTGALKTDFTKTGKRTYKGILNDGVNAVMRYYVNNFSDGAKQDGLDLMLGNFRSTSTTHSPFVERPDRDSLANLLVRIFVFFIASFSFFLLAYRTISPLLYIIGEKDFFIPLRQLVVSKLNLIRDYNHNINNSSNASVIHKTIVAICEPIIKLFLRFWHSSNSQKLSVFLVASSWLTTLFAGQLSFIIMKKGSRIGELMVKRPRLLPEPLPKGFME